MNRRSKEEEWRHTPIAGFLLRNWRGERKGEKGHVGEGRLRAFHSANFTHKRSFAKVVAGAHTNLTGSPQDSLRPERNEVHFHLKYYRELIARIEAIAREKKIDIFKKFVGVATLVGCSVAGAQTPEVTWSDPTTQIWADTYRSLYVADWQDGINAEIATQANPGDISVIADPAVAGRKSLRIGMSRNENFANVANGSPRAELLLPAPVSFAQGKDYLIRWSTFLPIGFTFDTKQLVIITQIHQSFAAGAPTIALTLLGTQYTISERGGQNPTNVSGGKSLCCADTDTGKWVNWALRYIPDDTGTHSSVELYKNGQSVYAVEGVPNAYLNDQSAYLKIGLYKPNWVTQPSDVNQITMFFGPVYVSQR